MSNINKQALRAAAERAKDGFIPNFRAPTRDVLALLDELEAAQKRIAELQNDEVRQRLANAEHQLYMAELAKHNLNASRKAQFRKRIAAEQRIAELESHTVTVRLPKNEIGEAAEFGGGAVVIPVSVVVDACAAAGIQVIEGEQKNG